jgi:ELWxxDGT repeat protein
MIAANGELFFTVFDPNAGALAVWKSDGTMAGTGPVNPGGPGVSAYGLTPVGGMVYYFDYDSTFDPELWKTDGTPAGTSLVAVINQRPFTTLFDLTNVNGRVFFNDGLQLWTSDGTAAGTMPLPSSRPDQGSFKAVNGRLFFTAFDTVHGDELWTSDGTAAGTYLVDDINPGPASSFPGSLNGNMTNFNNKLFFSANDGIHGNELWESDGTAAGTFLVQDIWPGSSGSSPGQLTPSGGTLFFTADDGAHGNELWAYYPATHFQVTTTSNLATPGSSFPVTITALDRNGNVDTAYTGTVHLSSTDGAAILPADYTFRPSDMGVHTLMVTLATPGIRTITATDIATGSITGQVTLTVPVNVSNSVRVLKTGFLFNRFDGLYDGLIAIQNISGGTINGPIQIVLSGLDSRIKLARAWMNGMPLSISYTASGDTVITINVSHFASRSILGVVLEFSDPFALPINFMPKTYSDSFSV